MSADTVAEVFRRDEGGMRKLLLTVREAAEVLCVSRTKVYELLHRNELPSVYVDGCRRIPAAALEEYVSGLLEETS